MVRCPALHEIIQGFWEQGGGGLELSIDSTDQTVASVCHFIHTGMLRAPPQVEAQLELLRVSTQLGMQSLQKAVEYLIAMKLTKENVETVLSFSEELDYPALARSCRAYAKSGKKAQTIRLQVTHEKETTNASLKNAIYESLQDVTSILQQAPVPSLSTMALESRHNFAGSDSQVSTAGNTRVDNYMQSDRDYDSSMNQHQSSIRSDDHSRNGKGGATSHIPTRTVSKQLKPKSGGIYALLLQQDGGGDTSSVIAPLDANSMPGRVMQEKKPGKANGAENGSVRNKDSKRPSRLINVVERSADNLFPISMDHSALLDDSVSVLELDGLTIKEYIPVMSLKPPKEKSEKEKRLVS
jgi:hypothetical protein